MDARALRVGRAALLAALVAGCGSVTLPDRVATESHGAGEAGTVVPHTAAGHCGRERWDVKTLADPAAGQVNLAPKASSVDQLAQSAPSPDPYTPDMIRQPPEQQAYVVQATLVEARTEADSDFHLVLEDRDGKTMVAEIPDPNCAATSAVHDQIAKARSTFIQAFGQPGVYPQPLLQIGKPVTVTGVLFFDAYSNGHAPTGAAPVGGGEAVELHPVLSIMPGGG